MKDGKTAILFISVLLLFFGTEHTLARQTNNISFLIREDSKLRINGTSNVNDFECIYTTSISRDTLHQQVTFGDSLFISGDSINLSTTSFDCGKRAINRDLRKTLKAEQFPFLEIGLVSIEIADEVPFETQLWVTLAGVHRKEFVKVTEFYSGENSISFKGQGSILLTDFGLEPPTALFGLVKVDDEIIISFDLSVEL